MAELKSESKLGMKMGELKLEPELGRMMGLGLIKSVGDVKRNANGKKMGCFCAFDAEPSPEGCNLCNKPPLHSDDEENLCLGYAIGTLKEHRPFIDQIRKKYYQQIQESYGFDIDYFPGGGDVEIEPILNMKDHIDFGIMMKLANCAIEEYNEKEHNIEKANCMTEGYIQYFMTVKVLNLTIGTPIETFHINVARRIRDFFEEVLSCNPKGMVPEFSIFGKMNGKRSVARG